MMRILLYLNDSFFKAGLNVIKVEVSDTGIGIKEENMKHLFEEFYKINDR